MIKRLIVRRTFSWIFILLILAILTSTAYFYIAFQSKVKILDASVAVLNELVSQKNVVSAISSAINDFSSLAMLQITTFFILTLISIALLLFILKLYLIQKKDFIFDPLTKVYNKKSILFGLDYEIKRALKFARPLCVAVIDIDNFNKYNHTYGKEDGNLVLKKIVKIINVYVSKTNLVGRVAGDKFLVVVPEMNRSRTLKIFESIRQDVAEISSKPFTISVGLVEVNSKLRNRHMVFEELNKHLYLAKLAGRNVVR